MGGNFFKSIFVIIVLGGTQSCSTPAEQDCPDDYLESVTTIFQRGDSNILNEYLYAFGEGIPERIPVGMNYNYEPTFNLPLDITQDTCTFCFVRKDLTIDTIVLAYNRKFSVFKHCFLCHISNRVLNNCSANINKDSSQLKIVFGDPILTLVRKK